jgi:NDP-sugar pyrophosphorylase family protein
VGSPLWPIDAQTLKGATDQLGLDPRDFRSSWDFAAEVQTTLQRKITDRFVSESSSVARSASIEGPVYISDGVKILGNATVIGPAFIGKDAVVGHNSLIRRSFVGPSTVVGFLVDVARSFVGSRCWLSRTHIADSFLCDEVSVGGGTIFASLKTNGSDVIVRDEQGAEIFSAPKVGAIVGARTLFSAGTLIMPGVSIGSACIVGAGVVLKKDLADGWLIRVKQELDEREITSDYSDSTRTEFRQELEQEIDSHVSS